MYNIGMYIFLHIHSVEFEVHCIDEKVKILLNCSVIDFLRNYLSNTPEVIFHVMELNW